MVLQNKSRIQKYFYIKSKKTLIKRKSSYIKSLEASLFNEKQQTPSKHCIKLIFGMEERVKKKSSFNDEILSFNKTKDLI